MVIRKRSIPLWMHTWADWSKIMTAPMSALPLESSRSRRLQEHARARGPRDPAALLQGEIRV
jgi:hypothetical protein